jgi:hypothetical protein
MSKSGAAYAAAVTIRHLLRHLEEKGVLPAAELRQLREAVSNELADAETRGALAPEAAAIAGRTVEMLFLPLSQTPGGEPETIASEDLNASNDE